MTTAIKEKYTPGPWRITRSSDGESVDVRGPKRGDGSSDFIAFASDINERDANALLIAAAPEMLGKLERLYEWLERLAKNAEMQAQHNRQFQSLVEANKADAKNYHATAADVMAVIRKARGEQ